jgi:hypothetical protein
MDGFKNTTKTQYSMGGSAKFGKVMREFKAGTLHSGSKKGPAVTNPKQAFAIAASEARKSGAKMPMKKAGGGAVEKSKIIAAGDIGGYGDKGTHRYNREGPGYRMDETEFRISRDISARDDADMKRAARPKASKLDKMAGVEAERRQNRMGIATKGFDEDTGVGLTQNSRISNPVKRAASDAVRPRAYAEGGPLSRKTGTQTDPEYGDFVAAGAAKPSAMAVKKPAPMAKKAVPTASTKKPMPRAMFGDEAAAAMDRSGKAGMTAAEKREGYNMGGAAMRMAEEDYGYKKGGRAKGSKGPKVMAEKMVATKRTATPTMNAQEMRTMQRYRAAMASRPRREPMIGGDMGGDQIGPAIRQLAMAPEAPPTMGMRKGGYSGMKMRKGGTSR